MIDWHRSGRTDVFRYVLVEWPTFRELGEIKNVVSCTITENSLSSLKASGKLECCSDPAIGDNLVRVYSDSTLGGMAQTICHGTFFATTPSATISDVADGVACDMYSTLWILQQNKVVETYTAPAGTNAVDLAAELAKGYGNKLNVIATPSGAALSADHTWDAGTSYLEIVNWLLDFAGYGSVGVDAYANAIMAPYVPPASKAPRVTFSDTQDSLSESSFTRTFDTFEVPNKVVVICSNAESEPMKATAINDDPENPYSTTARGKLIVKVERVSDIADQAALDAKARELLFSGMSVVESIEFTHAFLPFEVGDAVLMDYTRSNFVRKMVTTSREKKMIPGMRCKTSARRFVNLLD